MPTPRPYSRYAIDAATVLGRLIKLARKDRQLTAQDLADRAGISRGTVQRIEKGDLKCEIGLVFELAAIVGVKLFDASDEKLTEQLDRLSDKMALLPQRIRTTKQDVDDDF